ncbi:MULTISPECIES: FMN-dependent NADH-azoreductase [Gammaproteobacteria]|uniref:FMN-dependent NADH-azoreductase n=1 Tax=Gammaproteobacteria TaxID=1236 RepID=UPI001010862E|nr:MULTISPECIES: NAD(P)H-dependent oxidoreductase [Gammaproteobacteria]RXT65859.1 NAD(P)H dehydrogenase [Pseudomonas syringae]RXT98550.1 NAD(P)H dehydrogenase [Pseudomonas syringae]
MLNVLYLDGSARPGSSAEQPHGSHTRRLTSRFVSKWQSIRPQDSVVYRDLGKAPPAQVDATWIHAAFTPAEQREPWMVERLAESDALIDELLRSDLIVLGVPMYNFGVPTQVKAWLDNLIRVGRTFGFDLARGDVPYWPLLADQGRRAVLLSSRGDYGYDAGGRLSADNHVEGGVMAALRYIGIKDFDSIAIEFDEFRDARVVESIEKAEFAVDNLVKNLTGWANTQESLNSKK